MLQMVAGRKYSAKTSCFTAVIFDPVTEIMSSLPRCNHQTISEIWSKCTMRRLARGATIPTSSKIWTPNRRERYVLCKLFMFWKSAD